MFKNFRISSIAIAAFIILLLYGKINIYLNYMFGFMFFCLWGITKKHNHSQNSSFLQIDSLAQSSGLNSVSPELKLFIAVTGLILSVSCNSYIVGIGIFAIMFGVNIFWGKIKFHDYIELLTIPVVFIIMSGFILLFDFTKEAIGVINIPILGQYLAVTSQNQEHTAITVFKALGAISCLYMLSLSTPIAEIIKVLRKIHLPEIIIELMYLIYRYIFILLAMLSNMISSAHSRLGYRNNKTSFYTYSHIAANLLSVSFLKCSKMLDAMDARCYDGKIEFLQEDKPIRTKDIIGATAIMILFVLLFMIRKGGLLF
ncbi:MAG: cobalt ECF transporter T component CbiQ [Oscillospiraceae bacterium]